MKEIYEALLGNPGFSNLVNQLKKRNELFSLIHSHLAPELKDACTLGGYENNILTISLKSGVFATHFRYAIKNLKTQLKQYREFQHLSEIRYAIAPVTDRIKPAPKTEAKEDLAFSEELCERFASLAANTDDPALKTVLERFSQKKMKNSEEKEEEKKAEAPKDASAS